ncbi:MAG: 50S ribosomal protein L16 [Promethearchaeia archaeon]|nr:MAG: 50S ribosomal protein L16 [Candidatus Lokiarchaeia archaeon]
MAKRRWKCFSVFKTKGYQKKRSRSHRREFVRGGADSKITLFDIGNRKKIDWEVTIGMISNHNINISHFALEAVRTSINRRLQKKIGRANFHLKIRKHPYTTYREHAMMSFAGADRLSSGMRNGFGRPVGKCARTRAGDVIMQCGCALKHVEEVKRAFQIADKKLCTTTRIVLLDAQDKNWISKVPLPHISKFITV